MGSELHRIKKRKNTQKQMIELMDNAKTTLVIHYSCESFYDKKDGKTPRITTIAVRNLSSAQTDSFSIHQLAEEENIPFSNISDDYDDLEKKMLDRYFDYLSRNQHFYWVHWNMRDVNYGFAAIEHRYRVLRGSPILLPEDRKFDLSRGLVDLYGIGYIGHPRLGKIIEKNKMSSKDMLSGADEAKAFEEKEFVKLHQSTLRKVDILSNLFERTLNKTLKTNATWAEQYGFTPSVLAELVKKHWIVTVVIVLGAVLTLVVRGFDLYDKFTLP